MDIHDQKLRSQIRSEIDKVVDPLRVMVNDSVREMQQSTERNCDVASQLSRVVSRETVCLSNLSSTIAHVRDLVTSMCRNLSNIIHQTRERCDDKAELATRAISANTRAIKRLMLMAAASSPPTAASPETAASAALDDGVP